MATYVELYELAGNATLKNRVAVACMIAAQGILADDTPPANHAARLKWAAQVFANPHGVAQTLLNVLLAQNAAATVAQITGVTDASILTGVNNAVDLFADQL